MRKDPLYEQLRELSWQGPLTAQEEARLAEWLAAHPETQAEWDSEASLNRALDGLGNVPIASNFTARVLAAAQREAADTRRRKEAARSLPFPWLRWLPRATVAAVILAAGLLSYQHVQETRREQVAHSLAAMSHIPSVPNPEVLEDFDAIAALGTAPAADEELLRVLQ